jgi:hypothetical protein
LLGGSSLRPAGVNPRRHYLDALPSTSWSRTAAVTARRSGHLATLRILFALCASRYEGRFSVDRGFTCRCGNLLLRRIEDTYLDSGQIKKDRHEFS